MLPFTLSALSIEPVYTIQTSRNPGGVRSVSGTPGHYFAVEMKTSRLRHDQARALSAWLSSFEGYKVKEVVLPVASEPLGSALVSGTAPNGMPQVEALDVADGRRVQIKHWQAEQLQALAPGDFVAFSGHKKVYEVADCDPVGSSGAAWLTLTAPLLKTPGIGADVQIRPAFCLAPEGNLPRVNQGGNVLQEYRMTFTEDWQ